MKTLLKTLLLIVVILAALSAQAQEMPSEISVSAESWAWVPPDVVRVTVAIEKSAASSSEALKSTEKTANEVSTKVKSLSFKSLKTVNRGSELLKGVRTSGASKSGVRAVRYLGFETQELAKVNSLIEGALGAGANAVSDVRYFVRKSREVKFKAMNDAAAKAKVKAQAIAKTLGVELGQLLSVSVVEEPAGRMLRLRKRSGEEHGQYGDEDIHVIVNVRYGVAG